MARSRMMERWFTPPRGDHEVVQVLRAVCVQDRKVIMKSFKSYVVKICTEEFGHLALLAMFDSVDDTKILQKIILDVSLSSLLASTSKDDNSQWFKAAVQVWKLCS